MAAGQRPGFSEFRTSEGFCLFKCQNFEGEFLPSETSNTDSKYLASIAAAVSEVWTILIFLEPDRKVLRDTRTES